MHRHDCHVIMYYVNLLTLEPAVAMFCEDGHPIFRSRVHRVPACIVQRIWVRAILVRLYASLDLLYKALRLLIITILFHTLLLSLLYLLILYCLVSCITFKLLSRPSNMS